jgi:RNA polymerase sigma-70 factor (ECF subfamily)
MTCKGILDTLSDYLEGDAGVSVCNEIEEHLDGCERCRMHVDTMRAIVTLYKGWRGDQIPDDVSGRLQEALAETVERACRKPTGKSTVKPRRKPKK